MVTRTLLGGALIFLLMGHARSGEELVALRALQGAITGVMAAASAMVASVAPRERIGFAFGVLQIGMWTGHSVGPVVGGVIADLFGYRRAFDVTALLLASAGIGVLLIADDPFVRKVKKEVHIPLSLSVWQDWKHILTTAGLSVTLLQRFLFSVGRWVARPYLPLVVLMLLPQSPAVATLTGLLMGGMALASTLSSFYFGRVGDRWGHGRVALICAVLCSISLALQTMVDQYEYLLLFNVLLGAGLGGLVTSLAAILASKADKDEIGSVFGLDNSAQALGRTVGPMLGSLFIAVFSLRAIFPVSALLFGVLAAFFLFTRPSSVTSHVQASHP